MFAYHFDTPLSGLSDFEDKVNIVRFQPLKWEYEQFLHSCTTLSTI